MNMKRSNTRNKQRGSATVEAVVAFTGFLFTIFTILNVINYCRTQMLISAAVDTAAKEIAQYSYFYKMSGLQKFSEDFSANTQVGKDKINEVIGSVDDLYGALVSAKDETQQDVTNFMNATEDGTVSYEHIETILNGIDANGSNIESGIQGVSNAMSKVGSNPILYLKSIVAIAGSAGLDAAKSRVIAVPLARMFVQKHFGGSIEEANKTLKGLGIEDGMEGLNFKMSTVFSEDHPEDIRIIVFYKVKLAHFFDWTLLEVNMSKQAVVKAWLGGDNVQGAVKPSAPAAGGGESEQEQPETSEQNPQPQQEADSEQEAEPEAVNTEGSYWYLTLDEHYYDNKAAAFDDLLVSSKGITREETVVNGLIYGRDANNVAYGMTYVTDSEDTYVTSWPYCGALEQLALMEDSYVDSDGANGYEPGSTTSYVYVVYVPDNISDEEIEKIREKYNESSQYWYEEGKELLGRDIDVAVEIVRGGGNYDYGSGE